MTHAAFAALVGRVAPWLARAERLLQPRLTSLACPPAEYLIGGVCLVLAILLFLPIPMGNMLPAVAICMLALGILECDGVWVLAGLATAIAAVGLVWGVVYALIRSAIYFFVNTFN